MGDEGKIKATMTRAQWREVYLRCQVVPPTTHETDRWMGDACAETHDVAEVTIKTTTGEIKAKPFEDKRGEESVTLLLSVNAVRGIKYSSAKTLTGYNAGNAAFPPSNRLSRAVILESLRGVGPDQKIMKQVMNESKLPDGSTIEEGDELESMVEKT